VKKRIVFAAAVLAVGSIVARAEVTNLSCIQTGPNEYKLSYALTGDSHTVQIFASTDATGGSGRRPILKTSDTEVTVHAGSAGDRIYFFLKPDHGSEREVSIRHLALEGTPNFRDLGGYATTDGHFVRWGLIYRSGVLSHLTEKDFAYLNQLGIRVVCDFRTAQENATNPEIWAPGAMVEHVSVPIGPGTNKYDTVSIEEFLKTNPSTDDLKVWMTKNYEKFVFSNAPEYARVFDQLKRDHLPLLYHCSGGKDRTGVFSAFVLLTLGVPENTVLTDYELTDKYLRDAMTEDAKRKMPASHPAFAQLTQEQRQALLAADPAYLESTLRKISEKYGSFENYRRSQLGVSDTDVTLLRSRLLE